VKKIWKSVNIWRSYGQYYSGMDCFFSLMHSVILRVWRSVFLVPCDILHMLFMCIRACVCIYVKINAYDAEGWITPTIDSHGPLYRGVSSGRVALRNAAHHTLPRTITGDRNVASRQSDAVYLKHTATVAGSVSLRRLSRRLSTPISHNKLKLSVSTWSW